MAMIIDSEEAIRATEEYIRIKGMVYPITAQDACNFCISEAVELNDKILRAKEIYARNHEREYDTESMAHEAAQVFIMLQITCDILEIDLNVAIKKLVAGV